MKKKIKPQQQTTTTTQNIKITYKNYYQHYTIITKQTTINNHTTQETIHYKTKLRKTTLHNIYTYIKQYKTHKKRQQELTTIIQTIDYIHNKLIQDNYYTNNPNNTKYIEQANIQYKIETKTTITIGK